MVNVIYALFNNKILSEEQTNFLTQTGFVTRPNGSSPGGVPVPFAEAQEKCISACYGLGVTPQYEPTFGFFYSYGGSTPGYNTSYIWLPKYNAVIGITINTSSAVSSNTPDTFATYGTHQGTSFGLVGGINIPRHTTWFNSYQLEASL